jgi:hypothetical protein
MHGHTAEPPISREYPGRPSGCLPLPIDLVEREGLEPSTPAYEFIESTIALGE